MPKTLVRYIHSRGWEINTMKLQGPATSVKFLEVQQSEEYQDIPSKVKDKLLPRTAFTTKKEVGHFVGLFCFWNQHILQLGKVLWLRYQVTWKAAPFK